MDLYSTKMPLGAPDVDMVRLLFWVLRVCCYGTGRAHYAPPTDNIILIVFRCVFDGWSFSFRCVRYVIKFGCVRDTVTALTVISVTFSLTVSILCSWFKWFGPPMPIFV